MLLWVFGSARRNVVHRHDDRRAAGLLDLERADVRWFLSIDAADLPDSACAAGRRTYRSLLIGDEEVEFSDGFTDLHTLSYQEILDGQGFSVSDARLGIDLVHQIRSAAPAPLTGDFHPFCHRTAGRVEVSAVS